MKICPKKKKNNFLSCLRKCVSFTAAARIFMKCKINKACILKELGVAAGKCFIGCIGGKSEVQEEKIAEPTCQEEVVKVRNTFNNSTREQRVILFARVYEEVRKRNPDSRPTTIALFMTYVFNPRQSPAQVCDKYKELFGKEDENMSEEEKNNFLSCLRKCVSFTAAARIFMKCKINKACILKELGVAAGKCFIGCIGGKSEKIEPTPEIEVNNKQLVIYTEEEKKMNFLIVLENVLTSKKLQELL